MSNWKNYNSLLLRGQLMDKDALIDLANERRAHYKTPEWEKLFWQFVFAWLNEAKDTITIKTSGSTGKPKSIRVKKQQMVNSALMTGRFLNLKEKDSVLLCLSSEYIAGKMMIVRAFVLGLDLHVVPQSSNPTEYIPKKSHFTIASVVPTQLHKLEKEELWQELNRFDMLLVGGAPITDEIEQKMQSLKTTIYLTYGMTETVSHIAMRQLNGEKASEYFRVLDGVEIDLDKKSCLTVYAPQLNEQKLKTNDICELNQKNLQQFKFIGRFDNVINSGGVKLIPEILERKLASLIIRSDFFFAGLPDERLGEQLVLFIENEDHVASESLFMLKFDMLFRLVKYEIPKEIIFISKFERTPTNKIRRKATVKKYLQSLKE